MSAIYDGLEMKIKVTKMYMEQNGSHYSANDDER